MNTKNTLLALVMLGGSSALSVILYNYLPLPPATDYLPPATSYLPPADEAYQYLRPVLLFLVMVLGMFFNQLFESLQKQKKAGKTTINVGETFRTGFRGITFWMALFVSPLIYFATYYLVSTMPDDRIAYFYAFQNGFFWYYVFNKFDLRAKNDSKKQAVIG